MTTTIDKRQSAFNVLFLCTGNSARSILAEAILNALGAGRIRAFSAGSHPKGEVNRFASELLRRRGFDVSALRSKSWDEFIGPNAPAMEFIVTVCDNAAGEACPLWPGKPVSAHWSIADPAAVEGSDDEKRTAFAAAYEALYRRISAFASLPFTAMDGASLQREIAAIGRGTRQDPGR